MSNNETWEYYPLWFNEGHTQDDVNESLRHFGLEGWELVSTIIDNRVLAVFFKRPTSHPHSIADEKELASWLPGPSDAEVEIPEETEGR